MEFLEVPLFDDDIFKFASRLLIDVVFLILVVVYAIQRSEKKRSFTFTAVMMNLMVFFICFTLKKLELGLGMVLGLFAIFAVLRYRTDTIRVKQMTYLFIVIGLAVINALSNKKTSYAELLAVNVLLVCATIAMERFTSQEKLETHRVSYDKMDLLRPERRDELIADIVAQTGFQVIDIKIESIDLCRQRANIRVTYKS